MPQFSGLDVLRLLKSLDRYQTIPVYILTATSHTEMRQSCINEGAAEYFTKPNTLAEHYALLGTINSSVMN